jgi:hypothetical protein
LVRRLVLQTRSAELFDVVDVVAGFRNGTRAIKVAGIFQMPSARALNTPVVLFDVVDV